MNAPHRKGDSVRDFTCQVSPLCQRSISEFVFFLIPAAVLSFLRRINIQVQIPTARTQTSCHSESLFMRIPLFCRLLSFSKATPDIGCRSLTLQLWTPTTIGIGIARAPTARWSCAISRQVSGHQTRSDRWHLRSRETPFRSHPQFSFSLVMPSSFWGGGLFAERECHFGLPRFSESP